MSPPKVLAHITLHNSPKSVLRTIESLKAQEQVNLTILVSDNASTNQTPLLVEAMVDEQLIFQRNMANLGFAAAQNQAAAYCCKHQFDYLFIANPDSCFELNALFLLISAIADKSDCVGATPLLFRADESLNCISPKAIDAAGMMITTGLRHFDRQQMSGKLEAVFGGTGAALLLKRESFEELALDTPEHNDALYRLYPALEVDAAKRIPLFDEAFFAYREDADFAWRAQLLGYCFLFVPDAIGYHERHVLPERRRTLSPLINRWSVRNRFLMQINNFDFRMQKNCIIPGILFRNFIVVLGVLLIEWSSLSALRDLFRLLPRAIARRKLLKKSLRYNAAQAAQWFV